MKAKVSLGLAKMPIPEKIEKGRHIVTVMTGNANFTTPVPALAAVTTAINNLEIAYNAAQGAGPAQTSIMHDKEVVLNNILTQLALYVESTANGVAAVIQSAGMDVKGKGGSHPRVFNAKNGEQEGQVILQSPVTPNSSYVWQISPDPIVETANGGGSWKPAGVTTIATLVIDGLTEGEKYWFRVAPVSSLGQGLWSDPISLIVT